MKYTEFKRMVEQKFMGCSHILGIRFEHNEAQYQATVETEDGNDLILQGSPYSKNIRYVYGNSVGLAGAAR